MNKRLIYVLKKNLIMIMTFLFTIICLGISVYADESEDLMYDDETLQEVHLEV